MNNTVYLYVSDAMADWEVGYLTAELNSGYNLNKTHESKYFYELMNSIQ